MHQIGLFGRTERDRILEHLAENHRVYLDFVRPIARELATKNGTVTIDDVRDELAARELPLPDEIKVDARVFGALFRCRDFVPVGQAPTRRADRIHRSGVGASFVTAYRLRGASCGR